MGISRTGDAKRAFSPAWKLFMQYKITWLVAVEYIYAGFWEYVLIAEASSYIWVNTESKSTVYLLWRVFIIHLVNFAKPA